MSEEHMDQYRNEKWNSMHIPTAIYGNLHNKAQVRYDMHVPSDSASIDEQYEFLAGTMKIATNGRFYDLIMHKMPVNREYFDALLTTREKMADTLMKIPEPLCRTACGYSRTDVERWKHDLGDIRTALNQSGHVVDEKLILRLSSVRNFEERAFYNKVQNDIHSGNFSSLDVMADAAAEMESYNAPGDATTKDFLQRFDKLCDEIGYQKTVDVPKPVAVDLQTPAKTTEKSKNEIDR